jgi:hypothetical protein
VACTTYGDVAAGTARRAAFSSGVEHVGVLYSRDSMREALAWLDATFAISRAPSPHLDARGPWILLLLAAAVLAARPLATFLPTATDRPVGANLSRKQLLLPVLAPMVATPLLLRLLPTHFLPVLVADYLAVHFALYGLLTTAILWWRHSDASPAVHRTSVPMLFAGTLALIVYGFVAIVWPVDTYVTSFLPGASRRVLVLAMLVGTLPYFLADEWMTRGEGSGRLPYAASKVAFVVSLALAVALDFEHLFFLIIIVPVIVAYFIVYGLISGSTYRRTGHPFVAAIANAIAFAWAIAVTFPLLAG